MAISTGRAQYESDRLQGGEYPHTVGYVRPVFDHRLDTKPRVAPLAVPFFRTDADRKPGKPLPPEATGDPRPDRLEHAERIRMALLARDNRYRIEGSSDEARAAPPRRYGPRSSTPDIPKPKGRYVPIPEHLAVVEARRGDQVLYFLSIAEAAHVMTNTRQSTYENAVKNAAGGTTKTAFGWTWTRLRSRRGKNR
jgi:hypothetical protein